METCFYTNQCVWRNELNHIACNSRMRIVLCLQRIPYGLLVLADETQRWLNNISLTSEKDFPKNDNVISLLKVYFYKNLEIKIVNKAQLSKNACGFQI